VSAAAKLGNQWLILNMAIEPAQARLPRGKWFKQYRGENDPPLVSARPALSRDD
jgi:hypothetical protein